MASVTQKMNVNLSTISPAWNILPVAVIATVAEILFFYFFKKSNDMALVCLFQFAGDPVHVLSQTSVNSGVSVAALVAVWCNAEKVEAIVLELHQRATRSTLFNFDSSKTKIRGVVHSKNSSYTQKKKSEKIQKNPK